jgi:hypothetical protein
VSHIFLLTSSLRLILNPGSLDRSISSSLGSQSSRILLIISPRIPCCRLTHAVDSIGQYRFKLADLNHYPTPYRKERGYGRSTSLTLGLCSPDHFAGGKIDKNPVRSASRILRISVGLAPIGRKRTIKRAEGGCSNGHSTLGQKRGKIGPKSWSIRQRARKAQGSQRPCPGTTAIMTTNTSQIDPSFWSDQLFEDGPDEMDLTPETRNTIDDTNIPQSQMIHAGDSQSVITHNWRGG